MFYADFVLSKKGPLARIWLAAHWDKKLTKAQIFETNIESSIERILRPKVKLALRTSGHLMLGVVRIYSRKTKYLLADCNEAFVKIKMAFRPGMVDLPEDHREAAVNAVTLPEVFHDFDSAMPDLNDIDIEAQFTLNQSRADEITMREDYGNVPTFNTDDGFGTSFDTNSSNIQRSAAPGGFDQCLEDVNLLLFNEGINVMDKNTDRPSTSDVSAGNLAHISGDVDMSKDDDFGDHYFPSPGGGSSDGSRPVSPIPAAGGTTPSIAGAIDQFLASTDLAEQPPAQTDLPPTDDHPEANQNVESVENNENQNAEQTTLLQNEEESFALAPVDASALRGLPKTKRKRKLIVDEVKNISGEEMKAQLSDTSDIVITLDLAPPTKRLMHWKETGGVEKLFALPGKSIPSTALFKNYQRHLTSRAAPNDEVVEEKDNLDTIRDLNQDGLDLNTPQVAPVPSRRGRKRKQAIVEEEKEHSAESITQEVTKKTRLSPKVAEDQRLSTIPEEIVPEPSLIQNTTPNDLAPPQPEPVINDLSVDIQSASMLLDQPNDILPPASIHPQPIPVTTEENNVDIAASQVLSASAVDDVAVAPPYPEQDLPDKLEQLPQSGEQMHVDIPVSQESLAPTQMFSSFTDNNMESSYHQDNQTFDVNLNTTADKDSMMANMGYDGQDQEVPNQDAAAAGLFNFIEDNEHNPVTPGINAGGGVTPWHDADYDNPVSVGPVEERGADETIEQFEERLLNKRAGHLYSSIRMRISSNAITTFGDLIVGNGKKQVAQKFYSLLVLKKHRVLELTQDEPYGTILLTKGPNFDDPKL